MGATWLVPARFPSALVQAVVAGSFVWLTLFVLFWLAMGNMALAPLHLLAWTLPWSWLELVAGSAVAQVMFGSTRSRVRAALAQAQGGLGLTKGGNRPRRGVWRPQ